MKRQVRNAVSEEKLRFSEYGPGKGRIFGEIPALSPRADFCPACGAEKKRKLRALWQIRMLFPLRKAAGRGNR